jgi:hypothetical protein
MITKEVLDVCPFDLDEPTKLWKPLTSYYAPRGTVPMPLGCSDVVVRFLSRGDAFAFHQQFSVYAIDEYGDITETTLDASIAHAVNERADAVVIRSANGRIIEEYRV